MTNLTTLSPKELEAYASAILKNAPSTSKRKQKRDSRPLVNGKRRRLSRKKSA